MQDSLAAVHLVPTWILAGHDSILAVDIGGGNIRAGIVELRSKKKADLSDASVPHFELWRHREDEPKRDDAVERLTDMLKDSSSSAPTRRVTSLPSLIGIGCPA